MFVISYKYHNPNIFTHNHFFNTIFNSAEVDAFFFYQNLTRIEIEIYIFF